MSRYVGLHNAFGNIGSAIGLLSLTFFLSTTGWRWTYLFWSLPITAWGFVLLSSSLLRNVQGPRIRVMPSADNFSRIFGILSPALLIFLIVIAVRQIGATSSSTFMTTYFVDFRNLSETTASLVFAFGPIMGIFGSLMGGYMAERLGVRKTLNWIIPGCAISLQTVSLAPHFSILALVFLMYTLLDNAVWSPFNTLLASITPESKRGLSYSFYFLVENITAAISPAIAAGLIEISSVWYVFPFSVVFYIASMAILQFLPRSGRR
jgi:predicted MFS family arabinose efflux permease